MKQMNASMWQFKHMQLADSQPNPSVDFGYFGLPKYRFISIQSPSLIGATES